MNNKAKVEGSICNAHLVEESSSFCSYYFEDHVHTRHKRVPRNACVGSQYEEHEGTLSIFKYPGRPLGRGKKVFMSEKECKAAHHYILLNCEEVGPYTRLVVLLMSLDCSIRAYIGVYCN